MSESTEAMPDSAPLRRFLDRHLALLCALFLVVFATLRVFFVSGFDLPTALSVLAIVNRTQLLTATVLSGVAFIVPLLFIQPKFRQWLWAGNSQGAGFTKQIRTALLWVPISTIVLLGFTLPLIFGWFFGWVTFLLLKYRARKKGRLTGRRGSGNDAQPINTDTNSWLVATMLGITLMTVLYQPWLAREALHTTGGENVVGNVVGVQGGMTLVLEMPGSSARWIKTAEIASRDICRTTPRWYSSSLASFVPRPGVDCAALLTANKEGSST
ncbi:hypothetical protein [Arthrobacter sp.]|uniref:hypothetical protein n=1 Tax=Arthrobacter sp. TaxID=1667 RepID=UPI00258D7607|nr:hypothetical protein [Arthrobacter sp.]